jgi:hypothetical protein
MGGAGGPDEGPDMEPRNYRFLKINKKPAAEATSETDPVNLRKKPQVGDPKKLALFRYDAIAKSEKTYEAIDTIATRIDIENILRHKFNKTVTPNTSKPKLINLLLAELK